ncbi:MAG: DUF1761 domain-containing protein [Vicinamibacterales bacterium]|jgi:hypothetical protein|nr:DUF1761 domain-containing protein [Vicinamibacterales bacterium]
MSAVSTLAAGVAYFALGGLWFTPLFGRYWDRAVGFQRPARWRPALTYYLVPLAGCLAVSLTLGFLLGRVAAVSLTEVLGLGLAVGVGISFAVTSINALAPNMPRPALYAAVTGRYHVLGAVLCAAIHFWLRG